MRALLVVNHKATTTSGRVRDVLVQALRSQVDLRVVHTERRGHAAALAEQAAADGLDVVVALGGDGTVNEVVNGLLAHGVPATGPALAVVPGGPTNVFDRGLDLVALRTLTTPGMSRFLFQLFVPRPGKGPTGKHVLSWQDLPEFTLLSNEPVAFQLDGDYLGAREKVHFTSVPCAVRVFC